MQSLIPALAVKDIAASLRFYNDVLGFETSFSMPDDTGKLAHGSVKRGDVEIMFVRSSEAWRQHTSGVSVWIRTDRIDDIYAHLKARQLERARALLAGDAVSALDVRFTLDLHTAFYGQREFGVVDPNGVHVMFAQLVSRPV